MGPLNAFGHHCTGHISPEALRRGHVTRLPLICWGCPWRCPRKSPKVPGSSLPICEVGGPSHRVEGHVVQAVGLSSRGGQLWSQGWVKVDEVLVTKGSLPNPRLPSFHLLFQSSTECPWHKPPEHFRTGLHSNRGIGEKRQGPQNPPAKQLHSWAASLRASGFTARGKSGLGVSGPHRGSPTPQILPMGR